MKIQKIVFGLFLLVLIFLAATLVLGQTQNPQPVFKIGVLDTERGPISNGARLAVRQINQNGGVTDAQGTAVRLELVIESPSFFNPLEDAVRHLDQAGIDLILGPENSKDLLEALPLLQSIGVPILTPVTDDRILASDFTQLTYRTRAAERLQGAALANYLVRQLRVQQVASVELDRVSFSEHIGFLNSVRQQLDPSHREIFLFDEDEGISGLVTKIIESNPQVLVAFGRPLRVSRFYTQLREAGWFGLFAYNRASDPAFSRRVPLDELHGILSTTTWSLDTATSRSKAFLDSYIDGYGETPGPIEAASYDAIYLLAEAISRPGDLQLNLADTRDVAGVQGILNPTGLSLGEMSNTVAVIQLNSLGGSELRARYAGEELIPPVVEETTEIPSGTPEGVFLTIMSSVQNVRTGPGLEYPVLGQLRQGETARLIGTAIDFSWVVTDFRGQQGWLATYLLDVSGDLRSLPIISAPPMPTPTVTPEPIMAIPTSAPVPIYIGIHSPLSGSVVAGNIPIIGSALHPDFLQYQLEFGPDPNPQGAWTPLGIFHTPVFNGFLSAWNTTTFPDGLYQIRLNVTLRNGIILSTVTTGIRVQNLMPTPVPTATSIIPPPIAAFTPDQLTGQAPLTVHFINQSSGNISEMIWHFGDDTTSKETSPTHTFETPGVYTVTLQATGPGGTSNFSWQINVTGPTAPVAIFTTDTTSGVAPLTIQFTSQSTGVIDSLVWNFGDGTTSTETRPIHTFSQPGIYNVILTVTGPGGTSSTTSQINVQSQQIAQPNAQFTADPTSGQVPLTVGFTDQSTGQINQYSWNFGDGTLSTEQNPVHEYAAPGNYVVTLIVTGPGGLDSTQMVITVLPVPGQTPTATFTFTPVIPIETPTNTPTATPTATATSTATPTATATLTSIPAPEAAFTADVSEGTAPLTVQFADQSSGEISSYTWDFGDGGSSNEANPVYTYNAQGSYTVILTVEGPGGSNMAQAIVTVFAPPTNVPAPEAAFTADVSEGTAPLTVQFADQSSGEISNYIWDFGDGGSSNEANPVYTYNAPGSYTVILTVEGPGGSNMAQAVVTVFAPPTNVPNSIVDTLPVIPDLSSAEMQAVLRAIYTNGLERGNFATLFTVAGDESAMRQGYLDPFGNPASYTLDDNSGYLQEIIDWYNLTLLNGDTSFNHKSLATGEGWLGADLVNPANNDPNVCDGGESPLQCELRLTHVGVVIISIGSHDAIQSTNLNSLGDHLRETLQIALDNGVIPIFSTIPPQPGAATPEQIQIVNELIIGVANEYQVPVFNLWRAFTELPNNGLSEDGISPSVSPNGPGDLTGGAISAYGTNARNFYILTLLDALRNSIFPDAIAP